MTLLVTILRPAEVYAAFDPNRSSLGVVLSDQRSTTYGVGIGDTFTDAYPGSRHRVVEFSVSQPYPVDVDDPALIYADIGIVNASGIELTHRFYSTPGSGHPGDYPAPIEQNTVIGIELDEAAQTLTFRTNVGAPYASTVTNIGPGPWTFYVKNQVCISTVNTGASPFVHAALYRPGYLPWTKPVDASGPFYVSDDPYLSLATDSIPNQRWEGRLLPDSQAVIRRELSFWPWGNSAGAKSSIKLNIANHDGALDGLIMTDMRDCTVQLAVLPAGEASYDEAFMLPPLVIDNVSVLSDSVISVSLTDPLVIAQNFLDVAQVNAQTSSGTSNALFPFTFGSARSVPLDIVDGPQLRYTIGDSVNVGPQVVRDKGYPDNQTATPPDFTVNAAGVITRARGNFGVLAADVGSYNCALAVNGATASASSTLNPTYAVAALNNGDKTGQVAGQLSCWIGATNSEWAKVTFASPRKIDRVALTFLQDDSAWGTEPTNASTGTKYVVTDFVVDVLVSGHWVRVGTVTGNNRIKREFAFSPTTAAAVRVTATASQNARTDIVEIEAWTYPDAHGLDSALSYLSSRSAGGLPPPADTEVVELEAGYAGPIGFHSSAQVKTSDVSQQVVDTYNGCFYLNLGGELNVTRLNDPDEMSPDLDLGTIAEEMLLSDLIVDPDLAPQLSTRATGGRNHVQVTDFATDASITPEIKAKLSAPYRITRSYTGPLARMYNAARNAPAMPTLLDDAGDVQTFIDHVGNYYSKPRIFPRAAVQWIGGPLPWRNIDFNRTVTLQHRRYGLTAGRRGFIKMIEIDLLKNTLQLTLAMRGKA